MVGENKVLFGKAMRSAHIAANTASMTPEERRRVFIKIADAVGAEVAKVAPCKRGCSHCCHQATSIYRSEAKAIGEKIGVAPASPEPQQFGAAALAAIRQKHRGVPCVFLKDGECSIYEVRPMACRTHFSLADDAKPCDIIGNSGANVPSMSFTWLHMPMAEVAIDSGDTCADIRDFFPKGAEQ